MVTCVFSDHVHSLTRNLAIYIHTLGVQFTMGDQVRPDITYLLSWFSCIMGLLEFLKYRLRMDANSVLNSSWPEVDVNYAAEESGKIGSST